MASYLSVPNTKLHQPLRPVTKISRYRGELPTKINTTRLILYVATVVLVTFILGVMAGLTAAATTEGPLNVVKLHIALIKQNKLAEAYNLYSTSAHSQISLDTFSKLIYVRSIQSGGATITYLDHDTDETLAEVDSVIILGKKKIPVTFMLIHHLQKWHIQNVGFY